MSQRTWCIAMAILVGLSVIAACATENRAMTTSGETAAHSETKEKEVVAKELQDALRQMESDGSESLNLFVGEKKDVVQNGDYVILAYQAQLTDGTFVSFSNSRDEDSSETITSEKEKKEAAAKKMKVLVLAGDPSSPMGLGTKVVDGVVGTKTKVTVAPENAFGTYDPRKIITIDRVRTLPTRVTFDADGFFKRFKTFPVLDQVIPYNPYLMARIDEIEETQVHLTLFPKSDQSIEESYGEVIVTVDEAAGEIRIQMNPVVGTPFSHGVVTGVEDEKVIVDMNHQYTDREVIVTYTIEKIVKPSVFGNQKVEWFDDFEFGTSSAVDLNKPILLFLYADWCQYCKKMLAGVFEDPWVRYFKDEYVWIKVNSDENKAFMKYFGQEGFPMTVLMTPDGQVLDKWSGYKESRDVRTNLMNLLNTFNNALLG